jgi:ABC-type uncharacterized transport system permease subunit
MNAPEITETDYLKAWAAFFFSAMIVGALAGAVAGGVLGGGLAVAGVSIDTIKIAGGVAGFLIGLPISYFFFRFFVSHFIVRKLSTHRVSDETLEVV